MSVTDMQCINEINPNSVLGSPLCTPLRWGGLIEVMYTDFKETEVPNKIKKLKRKLDDLEASKTLQEIRDRLVFTLDERNYLNSPLLDEIYKSIFSTHPTETCLILSCFSAYKFYRERGEAFIWSPELISKIISKDDVEGIKIINSHIVLNETHLVQLCEKGALKILQFLFEPKQRENLRFLSKTHVRMTQSTETRLSSKLETRLLVLSIYFNQTELVKFLLEKEAEINHDEVALAVSKNKNTELLKILLDNGFIMTMRAMSVLVGNTNFIECQKLIVNSCKDLDWHRLFSIACEFYNFEFAKFLLEEKQTVYDLQTELISAIEYDKYATIDFLLLNGAKVTPYIMESPMTPISRELLGL